jgi:hypothetical protein
VRLRAPGGNPEARITLLADPRGDHPGVDGGDPATEERFADALRGRTTATNNAPDGGIVDVGHHFLP